MPSPVPGMDPYLKSPALWPDVHHKLLREIRAFLTPGAARYSGGRGSGRAGKRAMLGGCLVLPNVLPHPLGRPHGSPGQLPP